MKPPEKARDVPVNVEELSHVDGETWRLKFRTIADDGNPTVFDEEITIPAIENVEGFVTELLSKHREDRAHANRTARLKKKRKTRKNGGTKDKALTEKLNSKFPEIGR